MAATLITAQFSKCRISAHASIVALPLVASSPEPDNRIFDWEDSRARNSPSPNLTVTNPIPVTFRYKHELDPNGIAQFGLVAEQVEKVSPYLVARDEQGTPHTVC